MNNEAIKEIINNEENAEQAAAAILALAPSGPPRWPHSAQIELAAAALAKAQLSIKGALKDSANPHFKSQYADLSSVWDSCHEHLNANGICVVQSTEVFDGKMYLVTRLIHSSGQWFRSEWPVRPQQDTPQGLGSAVTYARRYSLAAMAGVAPRGDDDDGNAASNVGGKKQDAPQRSWGDLPTQQAQPQPVPAPEGEKPQRAAPSAFASLPENPDRLPADVAKVRRELERFADKPFVELAPVDLTGLARTLDSLAVKATNPQNKLVLATLAACATAEIGKRATSGAEKSAS